jgi:hypothetical protein
MSLTVNCIACGFPNQVHDPDMEAEYGMEDNIPFKVALNLDGTMVQCTKCKQVQRFTYSYTLERLEVQ